MTHGVTGPANGLTVKTEMPKSESKFSAFSSFALGVALGVTVVGGVTIAILSNSKAAMIAGSIIGGTAALGSMGAFGHSFYALSQELREKKVQEEKEQGEQQKRISQTVKSSVNNDPNK